MSLDAVNITTLDVEVPVTTEFVLRDSPAFAPWEHWEPSHINHHARVCCEIAREWIVATDFSGLNGGGVLSGPRWLRQRFEWGPSNYPIYWCELPSKKKVDCGVLAALSHEVFTSRGVPCFRAQLIQEFSSDAAAQWRSGWEDASSITDWIGETLIYHEGVAVMTGNDELKLWDSSAGWWVDPKSTSGYGAIRALRVSAGNDRQLKWGEHVVPAGVWTTVPSR